MQYFDSAVRMAAEEQSAELAVNIYCEYGTMLTRESNLHNTTALMYALRLWETAHRLQPTNVKHLHNKGYALLKLGKCTVVAVWCHAHTRSGGSRGGSLGSIEPPFEKEVSGRLKQLVSKLFFSY